MLGALTTIVPNMHHAEGRWGTGWLGWLHKRRYGGSAPEQAKISGAQNQSNIILITYIATRFIMRASKYSS
ncbi:hypothetical protein IG631_16380 [Alternaria alternata]|nr:hypothetical protein IG631_16380 [Alternaria alternata]